MLAKNIVGTIIIVLNFAGIAFLLYELSLLLFNHFFAKGTAEDAVSNQLPAREAENVVIDKEIIPQEDDLLKDMDLSDLDTLDLDDFE
ncbi:MAG: hypothetical protein CSA29_00090 [Desulfobacterales bacterium]|nr:MAG: hypothetical protein CSA29_00090 [Desulfobacterales bacterium]